jgi:hypothetical protein
MANSLSIIEIQPAEMPPMLFDTLKQGSAARAYNTNTLNNAVTRRGEITQHNKTQQPITMRNITFEEPGRDETLFCLANHLVKGGMPVENIRKCLEFLGQHCNPPFPEKEISVKIESALKRAKNRERNLTQDIRDWISVTSGNFSATFLYNEQQIVTSEDKAKLRVNAKKWTF